VNDHVIVCGLRHVGLRLIEQLHGAGEQVVVIDDHHDLRLIRLVQDWGVRLIEGSARRPDTLLGPAWKQQPPWFAPRTMTSKIWTSPCSRAGSDRTCGWYCT
jgi:voltage-gated potassium channel Kch